MNKEIKFRFFDKNCKRMYQVGVLDFDDKKVYMNGYISYIQSSFLLEDVEVMQYTGLKDKNGVEIYEGDILEYMSIADGKQTDKVIFDRGTFVVDYSEDYKQPVNEINHCAEVIGNIYDNPELLEKEGK